MYRRSRHTRNAIPSDRRGDFVPDLSRSYGRRRPVPRYMRPTASWRNRTRRYGPAERRRPRPWERDTRLRRYRRRNGSDNESESEPEPEPKPDVNDGRADEEELVTILTVKNIDLNIDENVKQHHTDLFENTEKRERDGKALDAELVIRRAAEFEMTIEFSRPYDKKLDDLVLTFKIGEKPLPKTGTLASLKLEEGNDTSYKPDNWGARIVQQKGNLMTVAVYVPAKCVIGEWEFHVKTIVDAPDNQKLSYKYEYPDDIVILMNPWSSEDLTYLSTDKLLDEYVLNDGGALFYGNYRQKSSRGWNFAQFADGILDASLHLLRKAFGFKIDGNMADPVYIARALSKIVNNNDDNGVLVGKWFGDYDDGTRPTAWAGSFKILEEYMKTGEPVKYGQCWVFSGVLTTVCRALGLPCRSITNYASAHDSDLSCTIDNLYVLDDDDELERVDNSGDSVWNFHVWNEVWMKRDDLPTGYGGWQVIDATPQERSDGYFRLGPAPVAAVKKGEINIGQDTPFVFAEVNADSIDWLVEDGDEFYVIGIKKDKIGKFISTKKPTGQGFRGNLSYYAGRDTDREDLTDEYKFREGTKAEREAVELATKLSNSSKNPYLEDANIELELDDIDGVLVGEDFEYKVTVKNTGKEDSQVKLSFKLEVMTYYGDPVDVILKEKFGDRTVKGGKSETLTVKVAAERYLSLTVEQFAMKATATCLVKAQAKRIVVEDDFRLRRPDLLIEAPDSCKRDETIDVKIYFDNPMNKTLTDCQLLIEGSLRSTEHSNGSAIKIPDVPANSRWERTLSVKPKSKPTYKTERDLFLSFDCKELPDIVGYHLLNLSK